MFIDTLVLQVQELLESKHGPHGYLRTLLEPLDQVLGGGIRSGCITEIVGPAGLGKTQFCLGMCVLGCLDRLDEKGRVLYIDTEKKFSGERLCEIGTSRFPESFAERGAVDEMLRRVIVQVPSSSGNLLEILQVCVFFRDMFSTKSDCKT
jgi:RAD51-like protein 1